MSSLIFFPLMTLTDADPPHLALHFAGFQYRDLFIFDTSSLSWSELTGMVDGDQEQLYGRSFMGSATYKANLFIFGGRTLNGDCPHLTIDECPCDA
jgi:hypothetical protein